MRAGHVREGMHERGCGVHCGALMTTWLPAKRSSRMSRLQHWRALWVCTQPIAALDAVFYHASGRTHCAKMAFVLPKQGSEDDVRRRPPQR